MDDVRSRARAFLVSPCVLVPDPRSALLLELIEEYGESGSLDPASHPQLQECEAFASAQANEPSSSPDAKRYFDRAARLLGEIRAELQRR